MLEFYNLYSHIRVYEKITFISSYDSSSFVVCSRKRKLTENIGKYVPPNIDDTNFKNTVITNKNFDETWTSIIGFVSDSLFKIEKSEKDSGLLTLSFGAKEAEKFIDCGDFEYTLFFAAKNLKVLTLIMLKVACWQYLAKIISVLKKLIMNLQN